MKPYLKSSSLCLILFIITGCGASHRVEAPPRHLRTETYDDQSKKSFKSIKITKPAINGRSLAVDILEQYAVPEYKYDVIEEKTRYSKEPSLIGIINLFNPLAYFIAMMTGDMKAVYNKQHPPFGTFGTWNAREVKKNYQLTGENTVINKIAHGNYNIMATLSGYNTETQKQGRIKEKITSKKGHVRINIGALTEKLPERPANLKANLSIKTKLEKVERHIVFSPEQLVAMTLSSKIWDQNERERSLPVTVRQDMYSKLLLKALKTEQYEEVVLHSEKLRGLGIDLPESLDFFYGKALFKISRYKDAYSTLVNYTKKTGSEGRYYSQAIEILNEVNKRL